MGTLFQGVWASPLHRVQCCLYVVPLVLLTHKNFDHTCAGSCPFVGSLVHLEEQKLCKIQSRFGHSGSSDFPDPGVSMSDG